jgi:hypothetical protein
MSSRSCGRSRNREHNRRKNRCNISVDWEGRRQILAVELANRESRSSCQRHFQSDPGLAAIGGLDLTRYNHILIIIAGDRAHADIIGRPQAPDSNRARRACPREGG